MINVKYKGIDIRVKLIFFIHLFRKSQMFRMACLLLIATILRTGFVIISYGTKVFS